MNGFVPRSFGAQDQWIRRLAVENEGLSNGTFLDIGCAGPVDGNNTYELERAGWTGLLVDANPDVRPAIAGARGAPFLCADATKIIWDRVIRQFKLPDTIDYLSFDVDGAAIESFRNLPFDTMRFRYLTVEHDRYRFGDDARDEMRAMLQARGYMLLCPDVTLQGLEYEDWWVDPLHVNLDAAEIFRTTGPTDCYEIVGRR